MTYHKDLEKNKYVVNIEKKDLTNELKSDLKSVCLWSPLLNGWISRATIDSYNIFRFIEVMKKYSITEIIENSKYTAEELQAKKIESLEKSINNMNYKAKELKSDFERLSGDWAFVTQPNIVNSASGRRFTNYRNKVIKNYNQGIELQIKVNNKKEQLKKLKNALSMKELKENYYTIKDVAKLLNKTEQTIRNNYIITDDWNNIYCADGVTRNIIKKSDFERIYIQNDFKALRKKIIKELLNK